MVQCRGQLVYTDRSRFQYRMTSFSPRKYFHSFCQLDIPASTYDIYRTNANMPTPDNPQRCTTSLQWYTDWHASSAFQRRTAGIRVVLSRRARRPYPRIPSLNFSPPSLFHASLHDINAPCPTRPPVRLDVGPVLCLRCGLLC